MKFREFRLIQWLSYRCLGTGRCKEVLFTIAVRAFHNFLSSYGISES